MKILKIIFLALFINSLFLLLFYLDEAVSLSATMVNFSLTISEGDLGLISKPAKPQNISPGASLNITVPFTFTGSAFQHEGLSHVKTEWIVRKDGMSYPPPFFYAETSGANLTNFPAPSDVFSAGTYFLKVRYLSSNNLWSDYSDETIFTVVASSAGASSGGGGGGGGGGGSYFPPPVQTSTTPVPSTTIPAPSAIESPKQEAKELQKSAAPKEPSTPKLKKWKGPPLDIDFPKETIKQGKPAVKNGKALKFKINNKHLKKSANVEIEIKKKNGQPVFKKKEAIKSNKKILKKTIKETKDFSIGDYVMVLSYKDEDDGTAFLFAKDFEIIPETLLRRSLFNILTWNEFILGGLLLAGSLFIFRKKYF